MPMLAHDVAKGYHVIVAQLQGKRVEIPAHYDMWMRGARHGLVVGHSDKFRCVYVRMDNPVVKGRLKVWYGDMEFMKVL